MECPVNSSLRNKAQEAVTVLLCSEIIVRGPYSPSKCQHGCGITVAKCSFSVLTISMDLLSGLFLLNSIVFISVPLILYQIICSFVLVLK